MSKGEKELEDFEDHGKLYRRWGTFFHYRQDYEKAAEYLNLSLNLKKDDSLGLYKRSVTHQNRGNSTGARTDALLAYNQGKDKHKYAVQLCDTTKDMNKLEQHAIEIYSFRKLFTGTKTSHYKTRIDVLNSNYDDTLGESLRPFFIQNIKRINFISDEIKRTEKVDDRKLWKRRIEDGECDVTSAIEEKKELLHPREIARRHRMFRVFNQRYYQKSWRDMYFLKMLNKDKRLKLPQTKLSTPILSNDLKLEYEAAYTYMLMLHARSPLYNERAKRIQGNNHVEAKMRSDFLYRIQFSNRRIMFTTLDKLKELRALSNIQNLIKFVESSMGEFYILRTYRIMPRKFEFYNDIYNIVALSFTDQLVVPTFSDEQSLKSRQCQLLGISKDDSRRGTKFVFGKRSTYVEPDCPDFKYIAYKKRITNLTNRLKFARFPIEKAYLYHEIARNHINQGLFDEATTFIVRCIEESEICNNDLWLFLGNISICRASITTNKVDKINNALKYCKDLAKIFYNDRISNYVDVCDQMNLKEISLRTQRQKTGQLNARASNFNKPKQSAVSRETTE